MLHIPPALRHRRFLYLWLGMVISVSGTQMQVWALLWHIRELTPRPMALGVMGVARFLPILLFSLVGGVTADRVNRRKLLFLTQSVMALLALVLALLTLTRRIQLWHIYTLTALQMAALTFDMPARQSLVPNLVSPKHLANAFSLNSIAFYSGSVVGQTMSGVMIATLGLQAVYFFNAASYLAVIVALWLMGPVHRNGQADARPEVSIRAIVEGVRFTVRQPLIFSTMIIDFVASFFASANTLMPIIARDVLRVGAVGYGWLSAAQSIGAMAAAVTISQMKQIRRQGKLFVAMVWVFGGATIVFGLARSFPLAMAALVFVGASDSISTIIRNTIRQLQTPDHLRGRMVSVNQIFFQGGPQLGEIEAGAVAQGFGAPFAVVSGGVACLVAIAWIAKRWPILRRYDGDEPVVAGQNNGGY